MAQSGTILEMSEVLDSIRQARLRLLQLHFESHVGHIGGNLSALDMMMVLHHCVLARMMSSFFPRATRRVPFT